MALSLSSLKYKIEMDNRSIIEKMPHTMSIFLPHSFLFGFPRKEGATIYMQEWNEWKKS